MVLLKPAQPEPPARGQSSPPIPGAWSKVMGGRQKPAERRLPVARPGFHARLSGSSHTSGGLSLPVQTQQIVPQLPRLIEAGRAEGPPQAALGVIRQVKRKVTPPRAVVVPEMMVAVRGVNPDRELWAGFHFDAFVARNASGGAENKKTVGLCDGIRVSAETIVSGTFSARTSTTDTPQW